MSAPLDCLNGWGHKDWPPVTGRSVSVGTGQALDNREQLLFPYLARVCLAYSGGGYLARYTYLVQKPLALVCTDTAFVRTASRGL